MYFAKSSPAPTLLNTPGVNMVETVVFKTYVYSKHKSYFQYMFVYSTVLLTVKVYLQHWWYDQYAQYNFT